MESQRTPPPAPRGSSPSGPQRPPFRPGLGWAAVFVVALAVNLLVSTRAMQPTSRVRVPYSPFFLEQVSAGQVASITSKGTAIQGTFTVAAVLQGLEADDELRDRDPGVREHRRARRSSCRRTRHGERRSRSTRARRGGRAC